jgi:phosphoglycerol transferase MdoB-like AlkP superfamily enzyme
MLGVGILLGGRAMWARPNRLFILLLITAFVTVPFVCLARAFGSVDVLSLVFHAQFGFEETGLAGFGPEILEGITHVAFIVFAAFALGNLLKLPKTAYLTATLALITLSPLTTYAFQYGAMERVDSDLHERIIEPVIQVPSQLPDIVIVYMEGIERTFERQEHFGNVFDPLKKYEAMGVSFTDVRQVRGTGWSLAGLVATQCGLPLAPNGLRNVSNFEDQIDFLGSITCLPDLLADLGYANTFFVGGAEQCCGFNNLFSTHAIDNVYDRNRLKTLYSAEEFEAAFEAYIVDDQMIFDAAMNVYDSQVFSDQPMLFMVETYGPHGAASVLSRGCTASGNAEIAPNPASAVTCTLKDMDVFLDHVKTNRRGRPTIFLLASDHLNHDPVITAQFDVRERSNTVIMFGIDAAEPLVPAGTKIDRPSSMPDVFPTLLAYAGFAGPNAMAGLGRSLFGDTQTLMEEKGYQRFNAELFPNPALSAAIWATDGP